ncbi:hypothetical protein J6590_001324 [Homalodisca vitripennis]|nr:hypothetical protein J6590_001324 [Homalodisca vitripennis]
MADNHEAHKCARSTSGEHTPSAHIAQIRDLPVTVALNCLPLILLEKKRAQASDL